MLFLGWKNQTDTIITETFPHKSPNQYLCKANGKFFCIFIIWARVEYWSILLFHKKGTTTTAWANKNKGCGHPSFMFMYIARDIHIYVIHIHTVHNANEKINFCSMFYMRTHIFHLRFSLWNCFLTIHKYKHITTTKTGEEAIVSLWWNKYIYIHIHIYVRIYTYLYEIFRMCTVLWVLFCCCCCEGWWWQCNKWNERRGWIYICIYGYIFIYYMMIFIPLHQLKNTQNYFSFCYFPFYNFHIQKIPTNQINFSYVSYFMFLFSIAIIMPDGENVSLILQFF